MANPTTNLRVRISADLADIRQGLGFLRGELAKVKAQSAQALPNGNAFVSGLRRARVEVAAFAASYLSLRGAGLLAGIADEAALLRGRVKQARGDYESILAIANETRSGLAATVDLYARVERSTRGRIKNQGELLTLTKAVNQAVQLSFTGVAAGQAAIQQLGQALGSGALSGDELKSIRENAPRLAEAIATGMGKTIGELKKLGAEGKLTTDVVIKALLSQADVLEREYAKIPPTIKGAFTQLRNGLVDYVGDQDAATGASRRFAETIKQIASDLPRYLDPVLQVITALLRNLDVLAVFMVTRMAGAAIPALITGFAALRKAIVSATTVTAGLRGALLLLGGPVGVAIAALAAGMYFLFKRTNEAKRAAEEHTRAMEANKNMAYQSRDAATADAKAKRQQALDTLKAAKAALAEAQIRANAANQRLTLVGVEGRYNRAGRDAAAAGMDARRAQATADQAQSEFDSWGSRLVELALEINDQVLAGTADAAAATTTATGDAKKAVKGVADAAELAGDAIQRQLKLLEQLLDDGKIKLSEFYAKKQQLQEQAIDAQIEQAKAEAATATSSEQQSKALTDIIKLQRDRAEIGPAVAREQAKAEAEVVEKLDDLRARLLEAQGDSLSSRSIELRQEFAQLLEDLPADAKVAGQAIVDQLFPIELAKAQLEQFESEAQRVLGSLQATESSLAAQQQAGLIGVLEGERQVRTEREASLNQLVLLRQKAIDFLSTLSAGSPEAASVLEFLKRLDGDIAGVASTMQRFRQQVADAAIDSVTNLFMDLVEGSKSAGEALRDFARSFILSMAQIAARALATYLVLQLLDAIYPGLGRATAAGMSAGVKHAGGIAGSGGTIRSGLNPALFGVAPRYHSGGIAGMAPDEVPAVLRRGEEVLKRDDPRHRFNGGGAAAADPGTRVVFVDDQRDIGNYLESARGERVIVRIMERNKLLTT